MPILSPLLALILALLLPRQRLALENIALRQQLVVLRRAVKRPSLTAGDKTFWLVLRRMFPGWEDCLLIVQPAT